MRTRADVLAELSEVQMKQPNSWSSSMAKAGRISKLNSELETIECEHESKSNDSVNSQNDQKIEFVINGYKVTVEPNL